MQLDTPTIIAVSIVIDVILLLILIHAWRTRTTYPGFAAWVAGTACWSIGSAMTLLFYKILPPFMPKIIGNATILLHPILLYEGLLQFHNLPKRWWRTPLHLALIPPVVANQIYFFYVVDHQAMRIVLSNAVIAILFARIALEPLCFPQSRRYSMQWLLSISLLPLIAMLLMRVWSHLNLPPGLSLEAVLSQDTLMRQLMFYSIIVELIIAYSYLALTSDRVEAELRESEKSYRELTLSLQQRVEEETRLRLGQERLLANHSRLAAMGEMISAIAHQWRQPLATLGMIVQRTHAVGTRQGLTPAYLEEFKTGAMRQVRYMSDTIEEFRGFYRPEKQKEPFSPSACIAASVRLFDPQFTSNGIVVEVRCLSGGDRLVAGFPNEFKQVILNLLGNARDAILEGRDTRGGPEEGRITVQIAISGDKAMTIEISDNGCGIPAEIAPRIFKPYFTTKEEYGGTGIGLYMSRMIVEDSLEGHLSLVQGLPGATFRIELPLGKSI